MNRRKFLKLNGIASLAALFSGSLLFDLYDKQTHIVGSGGAGKNTVLHARKKLGSEIDYSIISSGENKIVDNLKCYNYISPRELRNIRFWDKVRLDIPDSIQPVLKKKGRIILVSGLSGSTGTLLAKEIFKKLLARKQDVWFIASFPFSFEGPVNKLHAQTGTLEITSSKRFISYNLDDLREIYGNMHLSEAFRRANEHNFKIIKQLIN